MFFYICFLFAKFYFTTTVPPADSLKGVQQIKRFILATFSFNVQGSVYENEGIGCCGRCKETHCITQAGVHYIRIVLYHIYFSPLCLSLAFCFSLSVFDNELFLQYDFTWNVCPFLSPSLSISLSLALSSCLSSPLFSSLSLSSITDYFYGSI